ncbi:hypothetical protein Q9L58_010709, partial [Maublancomyces gigas]
MSDINPTLTPIVALTTPPLPLDLDIGALDIGAKDPAAPSTDPNVPNPALAEYFMLRSLSSHRSELHVINDSRVTASDILTGLLKGGDNRRKPADCQTHLRLLIAILQNRDLPELHKFLSVTLIPAMSDGGREFSPKLKEICSTVYHAFKGFQAKGGAGSSIAPSDTNRSATSPSLADNPHRGGQRSSGRSSSGSTASSRPGRSQSGPKACRLRDNNICFVTLNSSRSYLDVAHVIPYSLSNRFPGGLIPSVPGFATVSTQNYIGFWAFLGMVLGEEEGNRFLERFGELDTLENMVLLYSVCHKCFGNGELSFIPILDCKEEQRYEPRSTRQYTVKCQVSEHCPRFHRLEPGASADTEFCVRSGLELNLMTEDPVTKPLPHPALLLLHATMSNIFKTVDRSIESQQSTECGSDTEAITPSSPSSQIGVPMVLSDESLPP